ncbi:MBL fold metallo-hydrolase [Clostridium bovifaecis]|uniref:MBL fold metallo-hydrolase n=1 Tax=Clostridium bovifaecis TaxID=2184719 RepID=A0A6I6EZ24_9CLOT|nr:MBL fold metallo-hydrolase [Clostridium bovifaecis]
MNKAKIYYLFHDGFLIETNSQIFIFDYYNDNSSSHSRSLEDGVIPDEFFKTSKDIYVFVSHGHEDHFNPSIFSWKDINSKIEYILSSDIEIKNAYPKHRIISEGESLQIKDIFIKAYGSTDLGVSFLIKTDDMSVFHAGDLNWWHWYDESDEFNLEMSKAFKFQIDRLKAEKIDVAFFPVDYRLKEHYYLGGEYFIKSLSPKLFIPMHFWNHTKITEDFSEKLKNHNTKIVVINERGQEILF